MTVTYGLTSAGFVPKTLEVIREDMNNALRAAFGLSIKLGDKSIFGQIVGIIAALFAELWEQLEAVYSSQDPNKAQGSALDAVSSITGTFRPPASYSTVTLTFFGTPATPVLTGTRGVVEDTERKFTTTADTALVAVPNWAAATAYSVGDRVFSDVERVYQCTVAGTSHAVTPVSGLGADITDGTVHWMSIATGQPDPCGVADVLARATETGPVVATSGTINSLETPVFGVTTVTNLLDATPGRAVATDSELRTLRQQELADAGVSPADALRAKLIKIPGVMSCTVLENLGDTTNADGMPPHSVEALVRTVWTPGDSDQVIFDAIQKNIAAGIVSHGNTPGTAFDSEGVEKTIKFSRPEEKAIYVQVNATVEAAAYADDGDDLIANAIVAWGDQQLTGKDAVARAIGARAFSVIGVLDAEVLIDLAPGPTASTTIPISRRQIAVYDTSRITVASTPGEP